MSDRQSTTAYVGMGGNVGDRDAALNQAVELIRQTKDVTVTKVSGFIETEPVGPPDQRHYLNAVAEIQTTVSPKELLAELHKIEARLGRDRSKEQQWGPRTCDLDILLMGETVMQTDELTIPHPRLRERAFVLKPLAEIAPDVIDPLSGKTARQMLAELEGLS
jgi:2-amino-4-hydroxy-6-hydroxymethyldihydropteridine diphosphokinase